MSVRVNLLPEELQRKERADRRNVMIASGFVVLLVVLGLAYFWKLDQVNDARVQLDEEEAVAQEMQGEIASLNEFAEIQVELEDADDTVARVFGSEVGVAGVLQDLAVVIPPDTELSELNYVVTPDSEQVSLGQLELTGRTTDRHAPGLERLLLELEKVAAFRAPYFGTAAVDNDEAVAFDVSVQLGSEVLTRRYEQGIPEVLR